MSRKKTKTVPLVPIVFYTPQDMAEIYGTTEKIIIRNAVIAGAFYVVHRKKYINQLKLEDFLQSAKKIDESVDGKYVGMPEACKFFGVNEKNVMQLASDADALIKIDSHILINVEKLDKYVSQFTKKVDLIEELTDESIYQNNKEVI